MFCTNCGNKIENGNFCPNCGATVARRRAADVPAQERGERGQALPEGMFRDEKGVIRWVNKEGNVIRFFWMDETRVGYRAVVEQQADTLGSAFKEFLKSGAALVADNIMTDSDSYSGQDMPWDTFDEGPNSMRLTFAYVKKIKGTPKKCEIKVSENISSVILYSTPQQYPFILDYLVSHAPNAKVK